MLGKPRVVSRACPFKVGFAVQCRQYCGPIYYQLQDGLALTEWDAVPGGIGLTDRIFKSDLFPKE